MRNRSALQRTESVIGLHTKENEKAPGLTASGSKRPCAMPDW